MRPGAPDIERDFPLSARRPSISVWSAESDPVGETAEVIKSIKWGGSHLSD
jgi:hypothetical protein